MSSTVQEHVQIVNEKGMHARTASLFVQCVQKFPQHQVTVEKDGQTVDGNSVLGLLTLSASKGTSVLITVAGDTAADTLASLVSLISGGFNEE